MRFTIEMKRNVADSTQATESIPVELFTLAAPRLPRCDSTIDRHAPRNLQ
jgi:hypothetical protein